MKRRICAWLFVIIILVVARVGLAECQPTNLLPNPSFEQGLAGPQGWAKFGTAECNWELGGQEGERCISITGDGATAGWWYAIGGKPIEHNQLYRLACWMRIVRPETPGQGEAFIGLDQMILPLSAGSKWERKEVYFRAPGFLPELGLRFGQKSLKGTVYFDNISLEPAIAVSRSAGAGGGVSLGRDERIDDRNYTALHRLDEGGSNDRRFLDSYTARYDGKRWLLEDLGEVVYHHEVVQLGVDLLPPEMTPKGVGGLPGMPVDPVDPRSLRNFPHGSAIIEVEVGECEGAIMVEFSRDGRTWHMVGLVQETGTTRLNVPAECTPSLSPWVRLKSITSGRIDVRRYLYTSTLGGGRSFDDVKGRSHYLAVVYEDPTLEVQVEDLGELTTGGRNEVEVIAKNAGERRRVEIVAAIERQGKELTSGRDSEWLAPGSKRRFHLELKIEEAGAETLRLQARDASSGKLLFMLEGRLDAGGN